MLCRSKEFVVESIAKHHPGLIIYRKQPGVYCHRKTEKCDGKSVVCDLYKRPCRLVTVCDEMVFLGSPVLNVEGQKYLMPAIAKCSYVPQEKDRDVLVLKL